MKINPKSRIQQLESELRKERARDWATAYLVHPQDLGNAMKLLPGDDILMHVLLAFGRGEESPIKVDIS